MSRREWTSGTVVAVKTTVGCSLVVRQDWELDEPIDADYDYISVEWHSEEAADLIRVGDKIEVNYDSALYPSRIEKWRLPEWSPAALRTRVEELERVVRELQHPPFAKLEQVL